MVKFTEKDCAIATAIGLTIGANGGRFEAEEISRIVGVLLGNVCERLEVPIERAIEIVRETAADFLAAPKQPPCNCPECSKQREERARRLS